jgi:hypothetical protein
MDRKLRKSVAKSCPLAEKAFSGRRYLLPPYRQADYVDLDTNNHMELDRCLRYSLGEFDHRNEAAFLPFISTLMSLKVARTTFFLERELSEALLRSRFGNLQIDDIRWRLPCFTVGVPLSVLSVPRGDNIGSITTFTVARIEPGTTIDSPAIACELDGFVSKVWKRINAHRLEHFRYRFSQTGFVLTATSDRGEAYGRIVQYNTIKANDSPSTYNDSERAARREGEHLVPALIRARFIGQLCVRPIRRRRPTLEPADGSPTNENEATESVHRAPHLTCGR